MKVLASILLAAIAGLPTARAQDVPEDPAEPVEDPTSRQVRSLLEDARWDYLAKALVFGSLRKPAEGVLDILPNDSEPSRYLLQSDLRLDLGIRWHGLQLGVKPRLDLSREWWREGSRDGETGNESELYVNEWLARVRLPNELVASYGRENLQWGPSSLISPSNPFSSENGRNTPKSELPGTDYAKLLWKPASEWTLSLIANTARGRADYADLDPYFEEAYTEAAAERDAAYAEVYDAIPWDYRIARRIRRELYDEIDAGYEEGIREIESERERLTPRFQPTYAAKIDWSSGKRYVSLIASKQEQNDPRLGSFASWTASDALVVYTEGSARMESGDAELLVGGFYSLLSGTTFCLEYFFNESGSRNQPYEELLPPYRPYNPREVFFRHNYLLFQYIQPDIVDNLNAFLRWTYGIDDESNRIAGQLEYGLGDYTIVYLNALVDIGESQDEFGSTLDRQVTLGLEFTY